MSMFLARWFDVAASLLFAGATASGVGLQLHDEVPIIEALPVRERDDSQAQAGTVHAVGPRKPIPASQANSNASIEPTWVREFSSHVRFPAKIAKIVPDGTAVRKGAFSVRWNRRN